MTSQEKLVFCTLFDSNYLDKGLVLYESMRKQMSNFKLYIFAFDNKCFRILNKMHLKNVILLSVLDIMTDKLQQIKKERTNAEFCWTCTPLIIEHVLEQYKEKICTYVDADIYFYANPECVIQEMLDHKCSVGLVKHGFERNWDYGRQIFECGKYCIQFNTFLNTKTGRKVLKEWKEDCLNWCYNRVEDRKLGDQKYADQWRQKYSFVYEAMNLGAGVAPWNLHLYSYEKNEKEKIWMKYRNKKFMLIFYHFEGTKYLKYHKIFLNLWKYNGKESKRKVKLLYQPYFQDIMAIRKYLKKRYGITFYHMCINEKDFLRNYSLKNKCMEEGVLEGCRNWMEFRKNNMLII